MDEALRVRAEHCDLPAVLQLVAGQRWTGRLVVESERTIEATIGWVDGQPVDASVGPHQQLEAFYEAFLVPQRQIRLYVQERPGVSDEPLGELMGLLFEACHRLDEWRNLAELHLRADGERPSEHPELWEGLDGTCALATIVGELRLSRAAIVDVVRGWLSTGRVVSIDARPSAIAPDGSGSVAVALARGRAQVRSGDLRGAVGSFESALATDPDHPLARPHLSRLRELYMCAGRTRSVGSSGRGGRSRR